jgi:superfamily II DNA/RNA helicase
LETQGLHTLKTFLEKVELEKEQKRSYAILIGDLEYQKLKASVENVFTEHPKAELLKQIVKQQIEKKASSRMLVFTQYRDTASHLVKELNTIPNVKADRFVGQASRTLDKGLTQKEQSERIRMLEEGKLNVLVATSIAEEGLDIPTVDHVTFYEPIPSEIRYIQRRGRTGRKKPGKVTILATNESIDMIYLYASKKRTEKMKTIAENINSKLQPIIRKRSKPPLDPLTPEELRMLEEEAKQVKVEPETVKPETEAIKEFNRKVERAMRTLYMKLLERGAAGENLDDMALDMEYEGASTAVLTTALTRMVKKGLVKEKSQCRYVVASTVKSTGEKTCDVVVEKIYPNAAVVIVNDKWRARLTPDDYNGPKALIKKNSKFKATADLYKMGGTLCIRVNDVVKILN